MDRTDIDPVAARTGHAATDTRDLDRFGRLNDAADGTVVYYTPGCPFAVRLRVALRLRRVPFRSVRFRDDEQGAAAVRAVNAGNEVSPTVLVGHRWFTNPRARAVQRALRTPLQAP